jgi:hypothetical protein
MKVYYVEYIEEGKRKTWAVEALNPGHAFLKCKRANPQSLLVKCFKEGYAPGGGYGYTEWEAPKNQQLLPVRNPSKDKQTKMDQLLSESKSFRPNIV